ncbi:MAG TPA: peptidase M3 [Cyanobacteria bacterium UBA8156]|nr:peptidase M3 [Cyanobacteria bacterium UBA8156]
MTNPLLRGEGLPSFGEIHVEHIVPGMTNLLAELSDELTVLEERGGDTWETLMEPLAKLGDRLAWSWGIVGHLLGVKNSEALRAAHNAVQPKVVEFSTRLGQSRPLYEGYLRLRQAPAWADWPPARRRIVEAAIRDAELAGVGLPAAPRAEFNQIQQELASLATEFANNVLDATKAFGMLLRDSAEVTGLPSSWRELAAATAREQGESEASAEGGPWYVGLDFPSYYPFLQHSQRRDLREKLYRAYSTRAAAAPQDNGPILRRILQLRQREAQLLGYGTYAEQSLASKMAPNVAAVETLLEELRQASHPAAQQELLKLQEFAQENGQTESLQPWDIAYWSERLREKTFDLEQEALRPYFPLPNVLTGLFGLAERLFGVTVQPADGKAPVWHPDVRYFEIFDEQGAAIAAFYLDPYSRPAEKRGGAWMDFCLGRARDRHTGEVRLPVAYLVCNQSPPVGDTPSLMTFAEVETLFHEFGHGLQHMLTQVDEPGAAGINNVEWDAVELPSQFMENWCYDRTTLFGMAVHYQTGEPLPEGEYQKLLAAKTFLAGMAMLRQLHFSLVDLALHHTYDPERETPEQVRDRLVPSTTVLPPLPEDRFLNSFGHIFAGGYAAGYYSYKWAEVLSADAFAAFEEVGLGNEAAVRATGRRYRDTVLALGGSQGPLAVFQAFRGREPSTAPLLRHNGLAP